ncbi:MAG: carboxypeptidase-like regulatory domain-containing protein, partial [Armatimonadota bacterium]
DTAGRNRADAVLKPGVAVTVLPFMMRAAAGIKGRVLFDVTNKAVKGADVQAHPDKGGVVGHAKTGEDGTYTIEGISSGPYTISVNPAPEDNRWVAIPQAGIAVPEGKSVAAKDIVLVPGITLDGTVTDAETKVPIAGVELIVQGASGFSAHGTEPFSNPKTDATGHFRAVVPPGKTQIQIVGMPEGYLSLARNAEIVEVQRGTSAPVAVTLTLVKGLTAEGTVVGEDNQPLEGVRVRVLGTDDYDYDFVPDQPKSDTKGKWRVSSLMKNAAGYRIVVDPEWEVVTPKKFPLGAADTADTASTSPLVVVLKKRKVLTLSGRVVSTAGTPLPGAQIGIYARAEDKDGRSSQRNENRQASAEGTYSITNIRTDEIVTVNAYMNGYKYHSGGALTKTESGISVSDIVMVPLTENITGRVVRPGGTAGRSVPVVGAYVWSPDGDEKAVVVTDNKGNFTLANIPAGSVSIMSAAGRSVARITASTATGSTGSTGSVVVALPKEAKVGGAGSISLTQEKINAMRHDILQGMAAEIKGKPGSDRSGVVSQIAADDPTAALALAKAAHSDGIVPDGVIANIIEARAKANPAAAAVWAAPYITEMKYPLVRCRVEGELALALALTQPARAAQFYKAAIADGQDGNALTINRARLVATAAILRNGEAAMQLAKLKEALLSPSAKNERVRCAWLVARGDTAMADSLVADLAPKERGEYYAEMARRSLEVSPTNAERYLSKLFAARAELKGAKDETDPKAFQNGDSLDWLISGIAPKVLAAIGPSNPWQTLVLARAYAAVPNDYGKQWLVLGLAARVQGKSAAPAVWQEAIQAAGTRDWASGLNLASLAALASTSRTTDSAIAADLWQKAKTAAASNNYLSGEPEAFAYHAARFEPGLARMVIERSLARYLTVNPTTTASPYQATQALIALSAVDPGEALKRLTELSVLGNGSTESSASIASRGRLAVLKLMGLSDAERAAISMTDLMNGLWD